MTTWIGAAGLAVTLLFDGSAAIDSAAAAPLQVVAQRPQDWNATDLGARRRIRHHHRYAHRPYYRPYYYDRPYYYAPGPFVPFNFGYGFGPWW
jgi:hypothetical protein